MSEQKFYGQLFTTSLCKVSFVIWNKDNTALYDERKLHNPSLLLPIYYDIEIGQFLAIILYYEDGVAEVDKQA